MYVYIHIQIVPLLILILFNKRYLRNKFVYLIILALPRNNKYTAQCVGVSASVMYVHLYVYMCDA